MAERSKKILIVSAALDFSLGLGCIPSFWQFFKGLHELGVEVVIIPYHGRSIETPWWRCYPNPRAATENLLHVAAKYFSKFTSIKGYVNKKERFVQKFGRKLIRPRWQKYLTKILEKEEDVDAVMIFGVPLILISGIPTWIREHFNLPVIFYEGDMPAILPGYGGLFAFSSYVGADLTEYDAFVSNSKGIIHELEEMGAHNVHAIYYGVDPSIYHPITIKQDIDVFFYGVGCNFREDWMTYMITIPSKTLMDFNFSVGGRAFNTDLGLAKKLGHIPFSSWRIFCCRSKINLNITRGPHAEVYASSNSRPFELAALGCCIVSNPWNGLDEWFEIGKEVFVVKDEKETIELYKWLVSSDDVRLNVGRLARERVLKEHTHLHRAEEFLNILHQIK